MRKQPKEFICCDAELLFFCLSLGIASSRGTVTSPAPHISLGRCTWPCAEWAPCSLHLHWGMVGLPLGLGRCQWWEPSPCPEKAVGVLCQLWAILCPCESTRLHPISKVRLGLSVTFACQPSLCWYPLGLISACFFPAQAGGVTLKGWFP